MCNNINYQSHSTLVCCFKTHPLIKQNRYQIDGQPSYIIKHIKTFYLPSSVTKLEYITFIRTVYRLLILYLIYKALFLWLLTHFKQLQLNEPI